MSALWPELVTGSLARGLSVRCVAPGQSMEPAILDGESILVRPLQPSDLACGVVVLCHAGGRLLAHRIVGVRHDAAGAVSHVVTQGDAVSDPDLETDAGSVLGCVIAVTRRGADVAIAPLPMKRPRLARPRDAARRMGRLLSGSWRASACADGALPTARTHATHGLTEVDLAALLPLLHRSGCAPLAWHVLRGTPLADLPTGQILRRDYLAQAAMGALREAEILRALAALRAAGIEPLVSKGWAVARHYAQTGLRPAADVDLFVAPDAFADAERVLGSRELKSLRVDLHAGFPDLPDRTFAEISGRSQVALLDGTPVRVPSPDDLLRHVCLHLLRHAAWRPLWFADIGALLDATASSLDWDRLRSGSALHTGWVARTLSLAGTLLGAPLEEVPWDAARAPVPAWLEAAVLDHWIAGDVHLYDGVGLADLAFRPGFFHALARRWPSPLMASVDRGAPFDDAPRFPLQLADFAVRGVRSVRRAVARLASAR